MTDNFFHRQLLSLKLTMLQMHFSLIALFLTIIALTPVLAHSGTKPCHAVSVLHFAKLNDWQNGLTTSSGPQTLVGKHINDTLLRPSASGINSGVIAKITKDPVSNLVTLHIDQNCRWSNGNSISASDIKAGLESVFHPQASRGISRNGLIINGASVLKGEAPLSSLNIETPTNLTVQFESEYGVTAIERILSQPYFIPLPAWLLSQNPNYSVSSNIPEVFSGPYVITKHLPASEKGITTISLEANPYFCGTAPFYKNVTLMGISHAEQFLELASQRDDIRSYIPSDPKNLTKNLTSIDWIAQEYTVRHDVKSHIAVFRYNASSGPLVEKDLRKAITLAIDWNGPTGVKKRLVESNKSIALSQSLIPLSFMHNAPKFQHDTRPRKTRLKEALSLLQKHGYNEENPLQLTAALSPYQRDYFYLAKEMIEAGLPVLILETEVKDVAQYYQSVFLGERSDYDISLSDWGSRAPWPSAYIDFYYNNNIIPEHIKTEGLKYLKDINTATDAKQVEVAEFSALQLLLSEYIFIPFFDGGAAALFHNSVIIDQNNRELAAWSLVEKTSPECSD